MKRKIYNDLIKWKEQTSHKPLMILGEDNAVRHILLMNFVKMNIKMLFKLIYYKEMI